MNKRPVILSLPVQTWQGTRDFITNYRSYIKSKHHEPISYEKRGDGYYIHIETFSIRDTMEILENWNLYSFD